MSNRNKTTESATKGDLKGLRKDIGKDMKDLRKDIGKDMKDLRNDVSKDMKVLRDDINEDFKTHVGVLYEKFSDEVKVVAEQQMDTNRRLGTLENKMDFVVEAAGEIRTELTDHRERIKKLEKVTATH